MKTASAPGLVTIGALYVVTCVGLIVTTDGGLLRLALGASLVGSAIAFALSRLLTEASLGRALRVTGVALAVAVAAMILLWSRLGGSALDGAAAPGYYYLAKDKRRITVARAVYYGVATAESAVLILLPALFIMGSRPAGRT